MRASGVQPRRLLGVDVGVITAKCDTVNARAVTQPPCCTGHQIPSRTPSPFLRTVHKNTTTSTTLILLVSSQSTQPQQHATVRDGG